MSIEVNGVTLPDIPSEVLEQYPYAVIIWNETANVGGLIMSINPFGYAPAELVAAFGYTEAYIGNTSWQRASDVGRWDTWPPTEWSLTEYDGSDPSDWPMFPESTFQWIWRNHDIKVVSAINPTDYSLTYSDEVYLARNDSDPNYYAPKSWFDGMAQQVMRLTGTSDKLNTDEMLELAKGVGAIITVASADELPTDSADGTIAIIEAVTE